jgi:hypothetical protein
MIGDVDGSIEPSALMQMEKLPFALIVLAFWNDVSIENRDNSTINDKAESFTDDTNGIFAHFSSYDLWKNLRLNH